MNLMKIGAFVDALLGFFLAPLLKGFLPVPELMPEKKGESGDLPEFLD